MVLCNVKKSFGSYADTGVDRNLLPPARRTEVCVVVHTSVKKCTMCTFCVRVNKKMHKNYF